MEAPALNLARSVFPYNSFHSSQADLADRQGNCHANWGFSPGWRWFLPGVMRRVQQPDRALGMNPRERINGMIADRAALPQRILDGRVSVLGEHQNL
jgi:hypothetical protein